MALGAARAGGVSAALFAPGWVYEEFDRSTFEPRQEAFWGKVGRPGCSPCANTYQRWTAATKPAACKSVVDANVIILSVHVPIIVARWPSMLATSTRSCVEVLEMRTPLHGPRTQLRGVPHGTALVGCSSQQHAGSFMAPALALARAQIREVWPARSVLVQRLPLVSCFNTGAGRGQWVGGRRVSVAPWWNLAAQDAVPTLTPLGGGGGGGGQQVRGCGGGGGGARCGEVVLCVIQLVVSVVWWWGVQGRCWLHAWVRGCVSACMRECVGAWA